MQQSLLSLYSKCVVGLYPGFLSQILSHGFGEIVGRKTWGFHIRDHATMMTCQLDSKVRTLWNPHHSWYHQHMTFGTRKIQLSIQEDT